MSSLLQFYLLTLSLLLLYTLTHVYTLGVLESASSDKVSMTKSELQYTHHLLLEEDLDQSSSGTAWLPFPSIPLSDGLSLASVPPHPRYYTG